jgi:hypothetical protein
MLCSSPRTFWTPYHSREIERHVQHSARPGISRPITCWYLVNWGSTPHVRMGVHSWGFLPGAAFSFIRHYTVAKSTCPIFNSRRLHRLTRIESQLSRLMKMAIKLTKIAIKLTKMDIHTDWWACILPLASITSTSHSHLGPCFAHRNTPITFGSGAKPPSKAVLRFKYADLSQITLSEYQDSWEIHIVPIPLSPDAKIAKGAK